ncbi:hypothetical protein CAI21_11585 [Alkalilimnicola ehrlichii]|uniref:Cold-shock domain-containing protein n=1 Tax=Alkalilimnicola ehrlichii TaxID=351052 RepID=A0A3E0WRR4_9GAMM|nr:HPF/RaiA family ribosome-associated protein [Alkalilimnicola ehrlichii]RFA28510.1 hypothetical protein CAI21_11585 [Alkalilimnicola ehrlichii]RFA35674.1 hypothetical protein CAL65_12115 [Alkalilimnicola ehrlichii]
MQVPAEITFNGISHSDYNEDFIRERIRRLDNMADDIISCRVVVERPHAHRHTGNPFRVRIELTLPKRKELVVDKERNVEPHVQLSTVVREAFEIMERKLKSTTQRRRGHVKVQVAEGESYAMVVRMFRDDGYAFIQTEDGQEFYVHKHSVLHDDFDRLEVGTEVRFMPEMGEEGPQASSAQIVAKPGSRMSAP